MKFLAVCQEAKLWDGKGPLDWQKLVAPDMETFSSLAELDFTFQPRFESLSRACNDSSTPIIDLDSCAGLQGYAVLYDGSKWQWFL